MTVVVNTGDDLWLAGVRLMPDFDSLLYSLAGVNDTERGWGRAGETERVAAELREWGVGWPWFTLGDLDLGTHLARTAWLREGATPSEVATRLQARWPLGVRLIPATDTEVDTHVLVADADAARRRARAALPGVVDALPRRAARDRIPPAEYRARPPGTRASSRRSSAPTSCSSRRRTRSSRSARSCRCPGIREAILETHAPVVGVSPIIGGKVVRGMADACLPAIGVETTAEAVGRHYGARSARRPPRRLARRRGGCRRGRAARGGRPGRGIRAAVDARPRHVGRARRRGDRPRGAHPRRAVALTRLRRDGGGCRRAAPDWRGAADRRARARSRAALRRRGLHGRRRRAPDPGARRDDDQLRVRDGRARRSSCSRSAACGRTPAIVSGVVAGVLAAVGFLTFSAALAAGPISLMTPLIALLSSAVPVVVALVLGDRLEPIAWIAIVRRDRRFGAHRRRAAGQRPQLRGRAPSCSR